MQWYYSWFVINKIKFLKKFSSKNIRPILFLYRLENSVEDNERMIEIIYYFSNKKMFEKFPIPIEYSLCWVIQDEWKTSSKHLSTWRNSWKRKMFARMFEQRFSQWEENHSLFDQTLSWSTKNALLGKIIIKKERKNRILFKYL